MTVIPWNPLVNSEFHLEGEYGLEDGFVETLEFESGKKRERLKNSYVPTEFPSLSLILDNEKTIASGRDNTEYKQFRRWHEVMLRNGTLPFSAARIGYEGETAIYQFTGIPKYEGTDGIFAATFGIKEVAYMEGQYETEPSGVVMLKDEAASGALPETGTVAGVLQATRNFLKWVKELFSPAAGHKHNGSDSPKVSYNDLTDRNGIEGQVAALDASAIKNTGDWTAPSAPGTRFAGITVNDEYGQGALAFKKDRNRGNTSINIAIDGDFYGDEGGRRCAYADEVTGGGGYADIAGGALDSREAVYEYGGAERRIATWADVLETLKDINLPLTGVKIETIGGVYNMPPVVIHDLTREFDIYDPHIDFNLEVNNTGYIYLHCLPVLASKFNDWQCQVVRQVQQIIGNMINTTNAISLTFDTLNKVLTVRSLKPFCRASILLTNNYNNAQQVHIKILTCQNGQSKPV